MNPLAWFLTRTLPSSQLPHWHHKPTHCCNLVGKWKCGVPKSSTPWPPASTYSLLLFPRKEELSVGVRQESNIHMPALLPDPTVYSSPESSCNLGSEFIRRELCLVFSMTWAYALKVNLPFMSQHWAFQSFTVCQPSLIVSQQTCDVSCLDEFAENGVFVFSFTFFILLLMFVEESRARVFERCETFCVCFWNCCHVYCRHVSRCGFLFSFLVRKSQISFNAHSCTSITGNLKLFEHTPTHAAEWLKRIRWIRCLLFIEEAIYWFCSISHFH